MKTRFARHWDDLHDRMLQREWLGGALVLAFQALIVVGLFFGPH